MSWTKTVLRQLRAFSRFEIFDIEIEAELNFHIEMRTQENIDLGMLPEVAKQDALKRFGDLEQIKGRCRKVKEEPLVSQIAKPVKLLSWAMAISGFTIIFLSFLFIKEIQQVGNLLVTIAILLRLFLYVRKLSNKKQQTFSEPVENVLFEDDE